MKKMFFKLVPIFVLILVPMNLVKAESLSKKLSGKILLQIESKGEAWYVNPSNLNRYYMANGTEAYNVMRNLGVGITNSNLTKLQSNEILAKKQNGKIFLQVESKGEAYYVNSDGTFYYLKDGAAAYNIMRSLGLGIKNNDLFKIPESVTSKLSDKSKAATPAVQQDGTPQTTKPTTQKSTEQIITKNIGDTVQFTTMNIKFNYAKEESIISGSFGSMVAKSGTKFIVVDVTLTNTLKEDINFGYDGFLLVDNKDRQFSVYDDTIGYTKNYIIGRKLSPDVPEEGKLVYEVPLDATNYSFIIGKAGTNETYKIILK